MSIEKLKFDTKNFNKHTEFGMSLLEKSLRENGAGRSVLVDKDDNIIAGNGIVEAAVNAGITKTRVVEVTGDELVVVKRTDLELDSKRGREMALADNATAAADLAWDYDQLQKAVDEFSIDPKSYGMFSEDEGQRFFGGERNGETNEDYEAFTDKFKPKLTTDDCYTPPEVYEEVEKYVRNIVGDSPEFVRPFYPGGDYQKFNYPKDCVVVDNPPFSIYAEIVRWYLANGIRFFLFAPALTQIVSNSGANYVIAFADIIYENGANVRTSFTTNLLGDIVFTTAPELKRAIEEANGKDTAELAVYGYDHVLTPALIGKISFVEFSAREGEVAEIANVDALKAKGKSLYGKGWLLSERKEKERKEKERKEKERKENMLELSEREISIIKTLK